MIIIKIKNIKNAKKTEIVKNNVIKKRNLSLKTIFNSIIIVIEFVFDNFVEKNFVLDLKRFSKLFYFFVHFFKVFFVFF